jgi:hypothetical protein
LYHYIVDNDTHFPNERMLQPEKQLNPKNSRAQVRNQEITVRSVTVTRVRLLNCQTSHLSPYLRNLFGEVYYSLFWLKVVCRV